MSEEEKGLFGEREAIYESYQKAGETETSPEEEVTEISEEEISEEETGTPEEEPGTPGEEIKTVPLSALHEERERRKAAQADIRDLNQRVNSLIEDNRQLMEHYTKSEENEEITDYDKELLDLKKQNKELITRLDKAEQADTQYKQERQIESINADLKKLDTKLAKDGCPGMMKFQNLVVEAISDLQKTDFDRYETIMSSKENWFRGCEEIYKKNVFPGIKNMFGKSAKAEKDLEKEELKKRAKLTGKTGVTGKEETETEGEWTYDDYLKERKKNSVISGGL